MAKMIFAIVCYMAFSSVSFGNTEIELRDEECFTKVRTVIAKTLPDKKIQEGMAGAGAWVRVSISDEYVTVLVPIIKALPIRLLHARTKSREAEKMREKIERLIRML